MHDAFGGDVDESGTPQGGVQRSAEVRVDPGGRSTVITALPSPTRQHVAGR